MRPYALASTLSSAIAAALLAGCADDDRAATEPTAAAQEGRPNLPPQGESSEVEDGGGEADGSGESTSEGGDEPCCFGDSIRELFAGGGNEVVDIEQQGDLSITCGGFGARIDRLAGTLEPVGIGVASPRCQNIAFGELDSGAQTFYISHHGDSWVELPHLSAYRVEADDSITELGKLEDPDRLFEGLEWRDGRLFVTLHEAGLQVFDTTDTAEPLNLVGALSEGFGNAVELDLDPTGEYAYVADGAAGIKIVSVAEGEPMAIVAAVETGGLARHIEYADGRVYTALGGSGVIVHDVSDPQAPVEVGRIEDRGSAQQVAVEGELLAVAAWSHLALYDADSLELLGTERVRDWAESEQDLAVDLSGNNIFLGEWKEGHILEYEPGLDAPDLWLNESLFDFSPDEASTRTVQIENRGSRELVITHLGVEPEGAFFVDAELPLTIEPGAKSAFFVDYEPPAPSSGEGVLVISSNDPDADHPFGGHRTRLLVQEPYGLTIGDELTEDFAFLDPSGDLDALEGQVLVLAYFALF